MSHGFNRNFIILLLNSFVTVKPYTKGIVSHCYNVLLNLNIPSSNSFKEDWQKEFTIEITNEEWKNFIKNIHRSSTNARHTLIQFKNVIDCIFLPLD